MAFLPSLAPSRLTSAYAAAHYGKSLFWYMTELLFGFYLAEIYGLSPATLGLLLGLFLLWDAVTDPLIAFAILRRTISTRVLLFTQFAGAVLSSAVFCLVFYKPPLQGGFLLIYALMTGLCFRTAYTLYDVPQNALMKRLAAGSTERLTFSAVRTAFSALATLTVSFASALILAGADVAQQTDRFAAAATLFVLLAIASAAALIWCAPRGKTNPDNASASLPEVARATMLNPTLQTLFATIFALSIGWPLFAKLLPFYASSVRGDAASTGFYFAAIAIAALASQPLWFLIDRYADRRSVQRWSLCSVLAGAGLFVLGASLPALVGLAGVFLLSAGASAFGMLAWARLADRLSEKRLSAANDVLAFGLFTFASKIALSLGGIGLGVALSVAGYESGQPLPKAGENRLVWIMAIAPVATTLIANFLMRTRRERRHAQGWYDRGAAGRP